MTQPIRYSPDHRDMPPQCCPACGKYLDAVSQANAETPACPEPGALMVCLGCTEILVFEALGGLRVASLDDMNAEVLQVQQDLQRFWKWRVGGGGER